MGHKVSPLAFRIGYIKTWKSTGFCSRKQYPRSVCSDVQLRVLLEKLLKGSPVGNIFINHTNAHTNVIIYTSKPALVLGRNDENITVIKDRLVSEFGGIYQVEVREIKNPDINAALVADNICSQIEKRLPYRRVIKAAIAKSIEKGALGIKVTIGGRLNGAEIARREVYKQGNIPLQTIRSDIDFVTDFAETMYGVIGIKVWIYKGDVFRTATIK